MVRDHLPVAATTASGEEVAPRAVIVATTLTKSFTGVRAFNDVSILIQSGEATAILGQNGAGKSTLIQILAGIHPAGSYSGQLQLEGKSFAPINAAEAERAGVAPVPQEINIVPEMSVAENICLNAEPHPRFDVGARAEINKVWLDLSKRGRSFLYVSSDADELAEVCDRVVVMRRGSRAGELSGEDLTERALLRLATDG